MSNAPSAALLGFGCASLGSRISRKDGLAALERAHAAGITWFDVAPSYGDGAAESILGEFAASHPGTVRLCTKLGLEAEPARWKSVVRPLARNLVTLVPALRKYAKSARTVNRLPLTASQIHGSVDRSLIALRTERLDALMLHDVDPGEVVADEICAALEQVRSTGKVAAIGVASSIAAAQRATERPELYSIVQFANNPFAPNAAQPWLDAWRAAGKTVVTHSALGAFGALSALSASIAGGAAVATLLRDAGYAGPSAAADFLTDYALVTNAGGIKLFSAFKPAHLDALLVRLVRPIDRQAIARLGDAVGTAADNAHA